MVHKRGMCYNGEPFLRNEKIKKQGRIQDFARGWGALGMSAILAITYHEVNSGPKLRILCSTD